MRLLRRIWKIDKASPPLESQLHLKEVLDRESTVQDVVNRTAKKVNDNHLGPKMHKALGGFPL